ncbi:choline/ethanolamine kinase [Tribonema minus]|uniref:ethanolamine kinase n=1 Tax=Tribonema minus TaxID=303371 RepID=A0A836CB42_9STRA|nr:choline/ethanolamine kinase [Tribonema minus]
MPTYLNNANEVLPIKVRADAEHREADARHVAKCLAPDLLPDGKALSLRKVSGGITNELYQVWPEDGTNGGVLVRVYGCNTEVLIDRAMDNTVSAELSKLGTAPTYHGRFENGRVEGFLAALPLQPTQMGEERLVPLIAEELARMHCLDVHAGAARKEATVWRKLEEWLALASQVHFSEPDKQAALEALSLKGVAARVEWTRRQLAAEPAAAAALDEDETAGAAFMEELVFAHNDLLAGNAAAALAAAAAAPPPAAAHSSGIVFVDYEYAAWNVRAFDVANHWNEHAGFDCDYAGGYPKPPVQRAFLQAYARACRPALFEGIGKAARAARIEGMRRVANRYTLVSHLFWEVWAIIQAKHSVVDFDYLGYALLRQGGFEAHCREFMGQPPPPL